MAGSKWFEFLSSGSHDRMPCVAGQFYPGRAEDLKVELKKLFGQAAPPKNGNPLAILSPHAGYMFSGKIAASAFNQIDPKSRFDRIILIGSSHRTYFDGASVYHLGDYFTPLGRVKVDTDLANDLIKRYPFFSYKPEADLREHSLEVQLPFLQYHLEHDFAILPIILGTQQKDTIRKIADALKPFFNDRNLFVISSDFSHYPSYEDAKRVDFLTAEAIQSNSPDKFLQTLRKNEQSYIPGLSTAMCGWTSMLTLLYLTEGRDDIEVIPIEYSNSGDSPYGDPYRVVGYWAIAFFRHVTKEVSHKPELTDEEKNILLNIAHEAIKYELTGESPEKINPEELPKGLLQNYGVFVSVYVNGELRGCLGQFFGHEPLYKGVMRMAAKAATEDQRFRPLEKEELNNIHVEISVLGPLTKIHSIEEIIPGRHGIVIRKWGKSGTFLPQVALKRNWTREELLGYCARDKAGIGWDGWKDADIFIYEALVFGDNPAN